MSYVVKVGEYYVSCRDILGDIVLSKQKMRCYEEKTARILANKLNGEAIYFNEEVDNG